METATIAAVIAHYGHYSASLEREWIRLQQRQPEPSKVASVFRPGRPAEERSLSVRRQILSLLRVDPSRWWTSGELSRSSGATVKAICTALNELSREDKILRREPVSTVARLPKLYRAK